MTDWGDYTPGPWWMPYDNALAGGDGEEWTLVAGYANGGVAPKPADARLISKAYLIPRLEAALIDVVNRYDAMLHPKVNRTLRDLLAELRSKP